MITLAHGSHHTGSSLACHSKRHSAVFHVRAGDIQFYRRNLVESVYPCRTFCIILWRRTAYVHYHIGVDILYLRIYVLTEIVNALVLQSHTVEHSRCRLCHSRIVVALSRMQGGALHDNAAYLTKFHEISIFRTVSECA